MSIWNKIQLQSIAFGSLLVIAACGGGSGSDVNTDSAEDPLTKQRTLEAALLAAENKLTIESCVFKDRLSTSESYDFLLDCGDLTNRSNEILAQKSAAISGFINSHRDLNDFTPSSPKLNRHKVDAASETLVQVENERTN
jgi:hypothetical protein